MATTSTSSQNTGFGSLALRIVLALVSVVIGAIVGVIFGRAIFHLPGEDNFISASILSVVVFAATGFKLKSISLASLLVAGLASSFVMGFVLALFAYLQSINH